MDNVITAYLHGRNVCTTAAVYQYDSGMILKISGIELPNAYTVDFANSVTGRSISQVGGVDGVSIPDQFFVPGSTIHAWVVLSGTGYAVTRYHIMIPISPRAIRTNETPTPSQQSALDEAIAALNEAVTDAETAASHYPKVEGGYWMAWDVSDGEYVSTGVQAQGPQGIPGQDGADGEDGQDGTDGISPTIATSEITGGHRLTITDAQGTSTVDVMDGADGTDGQDGAPGQDGQDGVSPEITVPSITGGHRLTITDAEHPSGQTVDVMDGAAGASGAMVVESVSGSTPSITGVDNHRYVCGGVSTLAVVAPASGCIDVMFTSGSTPTVLTITSAKTGVTAIKWASGWDETCEANTVYEINILDGEYGVVGSWT